MAEEPARKKQKVEDAEEKGLILYSYWRSSCSWRVRIALAVKGVKYEYRAVHLVKDGGLQHAADYKQLNPMEQVPCLVLPDGRRITQSIAIIEYLEEAYPEAPSLFPADLYLKARSRQYTEIVNAGMQPLQNLATLVELKALSQDSSAWASKFLERGCAALEKEIQPTAGLYMVGDTVSVADMALIPQLYNCRRFKMDLSAYPTLLKIEAALEALPEFKAAHPSAQPDAQ